MATVSMQTPCPEPSGEHHPTAPWSYGLRLPHDARAAGIARTTLRSVLVRHGLTHHADTAELLAGEMVANAYRHTDGPCELRLSERMSGRLRISVRDTSPVVPVPFDKPPTAHDHAAAITATQSAAIACAEDGRGLLLIRLCADDWGGYPIRTTGGKLLWCELAPPGCPDPDRFTTAV
ncbi:ATP-binding protein [Streptomyces sp. S07_1.15]|uniref:ATP-binding protein n=1 Tax=Streptomyces sp. S07_1.15 TaxID=2873925 RepID=UPI001D15A073|nr:ATP-binding protein [Streptomyces sp. S07_1.15]MCC3653818.1 ATP-binding protein [Streptomyces sp. S07_1.15]